MTQQAMSYVQRHITSSAKYGDRQVMAKMFNVTEKYLRADKCDRKTDNTHD
jgi:hypothetical protein